MSRNKNSDHYEGLEFVEVADGRVSRVHCVVLGKQTEQITEAFLEVMMVPLIHARIRSNTIRPEEIGDMCVCYGQDCSSNGTFVNNRKLGKGESALLNDMDKISLVMSVAPMAEQYFIYHKGHPCDQDIKCFESKRNDLLSL